MPGKFYVSLYKNDRFIRSFMFRMMQDPSLCRETIYRDLGLIVCQDRQAKYVVDVYKQGFRNIYWQQVAHAIIGALGFKKG